MASNVSSKRVSIHIDHSSANNALETLQRTADKLNKSIEAGRQSGKNMASEIKKLEETKAAMKNVQDQIDRGLRPSLAQTQNLVTKLRNELRRMSEDAPGYAEKFKAFQAANAELQRMQTSLRGVDAEQKKVATGISKFGVFVSATFAGLAVQAVGFLKNAAQEAINLAIQGEGIKNAFNAINQPNLLDNLRKATRGTVSDLELMKRAVQANNFQIPLETMGTMLEFASRRARDTGESVDYMVQSIILGVSRKSIPILDNLGISSSQLQAEFAKTGDFAAAAMNVVNKSLEESGPVVDTYADKIDRLKTTFSNFAQDVTEGLFSIGENIAGFIQQRIDPIGAAADKARQEEAQRQKDFRDFELKVLADYQTRYQGADKAGRDKIIEQVKNEIKVTKSLMVQAILSGQADLEKDLAFRLGLYEKFVGDVQNVSKNTDTIAGIEAEIKALTDIRNKAAIGSQQFIDATKQIEALQAKLDAASGKTAKTAATKAAKDLQHGIDEYNKIVKQLNTQINDLLTPQASRDIVQAIRQAQEETEKLQKLRAAGSITQKQLEDGLLLVEQRKTEQIRKHIAEVDKLGKKIKEVNQEPVKLFPEIDEVSEADAGAFLKKVNNLIGRDIAAGNKLDLLNAGNPAERRKVRLAQLEEERQEVLKNKDLTDNERLLKEKELKDEMAKVNDEFFTAIGNQISTYLNFANQVIGIFDQINQARNEREKAALENELRGNEERKRQITDLEANRVISSTDARRQLDAIDAESNKKREALEKKQAERQKKIAIAQALINGALAVTNIWATTPKADFGITTAIMLGLSAIATLTSVATIAAQKFAKGGQVQPLGAGRINTRQNIPTQSNGDNVLATVRVGEVILNEEQQRRLGGAATFRAIGVPGFATGGRVSAPWQGRRFASIDYPTVHRALAVKGYATGGLVQGTGIGETAVPATDPAMAEALRQSQEINLALVNTITQLNQQLQAGIQANVGLHKIDDARSLQQRIADDAQFR